MLASESAGAPPGGVQFEGSALVEGGAAGDSAGLLTLIDPDPGELYELALVAGDGDTHNAAFTLAGMELLLAGPLDFEELGADLSIRVRVTDSATAWKTPMEMG
jgi:hypothetical protein